MTFLRVVICPINPLRCAVDEADEVAVTRFLDEGLDPNAVSEADGKEMI